jgi:hypothetical protein
MEFFQDNRFMYTNFINLTPQILSLITAMHFLKIVNNFHA